METNNIFTGKFRVVSLCCNVVDQEWTLFKRYGREAFVWEFCEIGSVRFPLGSTIHSGVLDELRSGHEPETTEFTYCSADRLLCIDRSEYLQPDGFVNIRIDDATGWSIFAATNTGCTTLKMSRMSRTTTGFG